MKKIQKITYQEFDAIIEQYGYSTPKEKWMHEMYIVGDHLWWKFKANFPRHTVIELQNEDLYPYLINEYSSKDVAGCMTLRSDCWELEASYDLREYKFEKKNWSNSNKPIKLIPQYSWNSVDNIWEKKD